MEEREKIGKEQTTKKGKTKRKKREKRIKKYQMLKHNSLTLQDWVKKVTKGCIKSLVFSKDNFLVGLKRKCLDFVKKFSSFPSLLNNANSYFLSFIFHLSYSTFNQTQPNSTKLRDTT